MNSENGNLNKLKNTENCNEIKALEMEEFQNRYSNKKIPLLNEGNKDFEENLVQVYYDKTKKLIWDPLDNVNKVLCTCTSICLVFIFLSLFYAFFIKG